MDGINARTNGKDSFDKLSFTIGHLCVIFTGYGLGLTGQVSLVSVWIISVVVFLVQLVLSVIWMKRHQFGPVEWLLRAFTYLEWPLWKKRYLSKRGFEGNK